MGNLDALAHILLGPTRFPIHAEGCPVSYNDCDSTLLSQLTAVTANKPSDAERQVACEVLAKLSLIRRTLTPAAATLLDAVLAAAANTRQPGATGKWIDKIDRHACNKSFPSPSWSSLK
jgi:hypothetical protein